jgi:hypothetical protein
MIDGYTYRTTHCGTVKEYRGKNPKYKLFVGENGEHHHATSRATTRLAIMLARLGHPKPLHLRATGATDDGSFTLTHKTTNESDVVRTLDDLKRVLQHFTKDNPK